MKKILTHVFLMNRKDIMMYSFSAACLSKTLDKLIQAGVFSKDIKISDPKTMETVLSVCVLHMKNNGHEVGIDGQRFNEKPRVIKASNMIAGKLYRHKGETFECRGAGVNGTSMYCSEPGAYDMQSSFFLDNTVNVEEVMQ